MTRICLLAVALAACASSSTKPTTSSPSDQSRTFGASSSDPDLCVQGQQRARTCTDAYIPALVDARAQVDHPAGIAAAVQSDRDGVIAQAKQEWATDSQDANIQQNCSQVPMDDQDRQSVTQCLAATDCQAYVTCIIPVVTKYFAK
ncbi:MAG TPA: hypothetical protein VGG28_14640 [Kofleriaceae bacterium]|jgi:hypothetical protein